MSTLPLRGARYLYVCVSVCACVCASVSVSGASHSGVCPNKLNAHLWVDAQSTCERECLADQDCAEFEKCCTNVCGLRSCVAARFTDTSGVQPGGPATGVPPATCQGFICSQQGATCEVWEGQAVCKCRDRCEKEPSFTCASDGLTYFNRCYMDAEACIRGTTLTVVTCRYFLGGPHTSPLPPDTTPEPTPTSSREDPRPPALYSNPAHQSVSVGGTVSLHCDVTGVPPPDVTWEKQGERRHGLLMRPDQMYGNLVVTNIGQLVIYNAQARDSGIYTCTARNAAGVLRADYPLSVMRRVHDDEDEGFSDELHVNVPPRAFSPAECLAEVDRRDCGERHVDWFYDSRRGTCQAYSHGGCQGARNRFETYEECRALCQRGEQGVCSLPVVQGPCRAWEARWAYNSLLQQCQAFAYGGCQGNSNSFRSRAECEATCPQPRRRPCRTCRVRARMVPSLCRSDFAIVGRMTELIEDIDSGIARFTLDHILRDEKMGLAFFRTQQLEVTLVKVDWRCPCPNVTAEDGGALLVMGEVQDGMALVQPDSYVRPVTDKRLKKIQEVLEKRTCEVLRRLESGWP